MDNQEENSLPKAPPQWMGGLTERENKEIVFCRVYAREFAHGAANHHIMLVVAKLAEMLDEVEKKTSV